MKIFKKNLSPNSSRFLYDVGISFLTSCVVLSFTKYLLKQEESVAIFLAPLLFVSFNLLLGIYTKFKVRGSEVKAPILSISILATVATLYFLNVNLSSLILWGLISWSPLVLPRIFLNYNTRLGTGMIASTIREKGPVLVVGGAGYIGSHVVEQLLSEGIPVRILDKFLYGKEPIQHFLSNPLLEIVEGDITDIMKLTEAINNASAVIHLAGLVGDPACAVDSNFTRHTNIIATRMLKEVAISSGVPRFIFASSCSVYGASDEEVDETSQLNPVSLYAQTKIDSERELFSQINENFTATVLRFATVFGHSKRPRFDLVANLFTAQAYNDGKITVVGENQWRPFIHVRDLARAIVFVLKAKPEVVNRQVFNVGDSRLNLTIGQLAEIVRKVASKDKAVEISINNNIADRRNYMVSFKKIKKILGYEASTLMEEGVSEMLSNFAEGQYENYRNKQYSNLEMTRLAVENFRDPENIARLYTPLAGEVEKQKLVNS
ncbi:MAG: NAD-dependent epimerase/dehydratase family protein [Proteobacteria bacterium]|nr:NAD-dependent epimerase/dehydratase family protein [Pseudomonadota bacterium]